MRIPRLDKTSWMLLGAFTALSLFTGPHWGFPLATWLMPVFGLRFLRTQDKAARGFWMLVLGAWFAGVVGFHGVFILSGAAANFHVAAAVVVDAVFLAIVTPLGLLPYAVDRWVVRRWFDRAGRTPFAATLVFPVLATALDFGGGEGPFGTFGAAGYSQFGWLPVVQLVSVTGLWGLTFLIAWFASTANYVWESGFDWRATARGVAVHGSVLVLVVGYGTVRLWTSPSGDAEVHVVGITAEAELPDRNDATYEADVRALHDEYLTRSGLAADRGADIVVWPEASAMGPSHLVAETLLDARELAADRGIYLVVTTAVAPEPGEDADTVLYIFDPAGEPALTHVKYGGTDLAAMFGGEAAPKEVHALETPFGTISGIVCWDADFPSVVRQAGRQGVDLLFVPANDWSQVRDLHAEMAVFRAVENGFSMVRQTSNGVSITTDAYGRVLNSADSFSRVLEQDVRVPLNSTTTLYSRVGDAVGWAALLGTAVLLIATWVQGRRLKRASPPTDDRELTTAGA